MVRRGLEVEHDRAYVVRDASTVSDAQVRDGVRPSIVARFDDLDEAIDFCRK